MLLPPFTRSGLVIQRTPDRGRGLFTSQFIPKGEPILTLVGEILSTKLLQDHHLALQVGPDLWLASDGETLDDCANHSCEPNAGFLTGELALYALRDIQAGEEIMWDYSTSINETGWSLTCLCGSSACRKIVRSWDELTSEERDRLRGVALGYLRKG